MLLIIKYIIIGIGQVELENGLLVCLLARLFDCSLDLTHHVRALRGFHGHDHFYTILISLKRIALCKYITKHLISMLKYMTFSY